MKFISPHANIETIQANTAGRPCKEWTPQVSWILKFSCNFLPKCENPTAEIKPPIIPTKTACAGYVITSHEVPIILLNI